MSHRVTGSAPFPRLRPNGTTFNLSENPFLFPLKFPDFFYLNGKRPKSQSAVRSTHVQYTQTDTIRQTDGPLVPMVPIENGVIPVVLLVNMHLIKGTLIIFPCDLAGYRAIPMVHWYQWYDWYQWKSTLFQWFYW